MFFHEIGGKLMKNIDIYISLHGTPVSEMHNGKKSI
jgi:hypothetical protein